MIRDFLRSFLTYTSRPTKAAIEDSLVIEPRRPPLHGSDAASLVGAKHLTCDVIVRARSRPECPAEIFRANHDNPSGSYRVICEIPCEEACRVRDVNRPLLQSETVRVRGSHDTDVLCEVLAEILRMVGRCSSSRVRSGPSLRSK